MDWLVTTVNGRQRATWRRLDARLDVIDMRWTSDPRVDWFVYDAAGEVEIARGRAESMGAAQAAAELAYQRWGGV